MIDYITIFTKGGTVLYFNEPCKTLISHDKENHRHVVNRFISSILLERKQKDSRAGSFREILSLDQESSIVAEWIDGNIANVESKCSNSSMNWIVLALYADVALRRNDGIDALLCAVLRRYSLFYDHHCQQLQKDDLFFWNVQLYVPPKEEFDSAFKSIMKRFQDQLPNRSTSASYSIERYPEIKSKSSQENKNYKKKGKEKTVWNDGSGKVTKTALAELDMSKNSHDHTSTLTSGENQNNLRAIAEARATYLPSVGEKPAWEEEDEAEFDIQWSGKQNEQIEQESASRGFFSRLLSPNRPLTKMDLDTPLKQMQQLLTSKNVALITAQTICNAVEQQLIGKKVGTLVGVKRAVRHALEDAIEGILSLETSGVKRRKSVNLLRRIIEKREVERNDRLRGTKRTAMVGHPFVIVMVGINGVGKSTSLAKIAYYLQSNQCNPLLAACDTFRSGAVEQLQVHASCLGLPLYHQGYAKDPSSVAKAAICKATDDGNDVVLIDTAGRMQNNVPLMKSLAKLVTETHPDAVLFVCEALVGNDGMDQLSMFQKALTAGGHTRPIDGIVLTKFDTVSDKVGAALTLTHLTGVPIVFCGTGQKYNHLKPLSVSFVLQSLFS